MKKIVLQIISAVFAAIIFGLIGLVEFVRFSGNGCMVPDPDPTCQCFCCHMFGLRGYESCGQLGGIIGAIVGILLVLILFRINWSKLTKK